MDLGGEDFPIRRAAVVPPLSSRTLPRASLMPLYLDVGFARNPGAWSSHTVPSMIPDEIYYTDPSSGARIPNIVTDFRALECFRLNTPLPVMTTRLAPPPLPDPFRSRPHPARDLGGSSWISGPVRSPLGPTSRGIVQVSQEEDQAITNLLKLHHQEAGPGHHHTPTADEVITDGQCPQRAGFGNLEGRRRSWTDAELEAAATLLSGFSPTEGDGFGARCPQGSAPQASAPQGSAPQGSAPTPPDSRTEQGSAHGGSASTDSSEAMGEKLSAFEGEAVFGLMCLKDVNILETRFRY